MTKINVNNKNLSRDVLMATLESVADGVVTTDINGKVNYMNLRALELTDWSLEEAIGRDVNDVIYLELKAEAKRYTINYEDILKCSYPIGLSDNTILLSKLGQEYYLSASMNAIECKGETLGIVIVFRDITKIRKINYALEREKNNLEHMFYSVPIGMVTLDKHLDVVKANSAFYDTLSANRMIDKHSKFGDVVNCINSKENGCGRSPECSSCSIKNSLYDVLNGEYYKNNYIELIKLLKGDDIKSMYVKINLLPLCIEDKMQILLMIDDITQQVNQKLILEKEKESSLRMLDNLPVMVWRYGNHNEYDYSNKMLKSFLENTTEMDKINLISPNNRQHEMVFKHAVSNRLNYSIEFEAFNKENEIRNLVEMGNPYFDSEGKYAGFIGTISDLTNQKNMELDLRDSREKYKLLFMHMNIGFAYCLIKRNEKGEISDLIFQDINNKLYEIFKLEDIDLVSSDSKSFMELTGLNLLSYKEKIVNLFVNQVSYSEEYYNNKLHNWLNISMYSSSVEYVALLITDIDFEKKAKLSLKKAKELAEEANKSKSAFLANISHEIRTPLNGIVGMINLTLRSKLDESQIDYMNTAKTCISNLMIMINDILDYSKIESGKLRIREEEFSLKILLENIYVKHLESITARNINIITEIDPSIQDSLYGDSYRISQVLSNFISNAIKFSDHGDIFINISKVDSGDTRFSVEDCGIGIALEDQDKLFKSFSQVDGSYTRNYNGNGLGLAISKELTELMSGTIGVNSSLGSGSEFYIILPLINYSESNIKNKEVESGIYSDKLLNILLIENDVNSQKRLFYILSKRGHKVDIVSNGKDAIDYFKDKKYDLILLDIILTDIDGVKVTKMIRSMETSGSHIPIVALLADGSLSEKSEFLSSGIDEFLINPFENEKIFELLEKYVNIHAVDNNSVNTKSDSILDVIMNNVSEESNIISYEEAVSNIKILKNLDLIVIKKIEEVAHELKLYFTNEGETELKDLSFKIELASRRFDNEKIAIEVTELIKQFGKYKRRRQI